VLLGISKRGDRYLRTLLVHGARSALHRIERHRGARAMRYIESTAKARRAIASEMRLPVHIIDDEPSGVA
jgi:hypothetical protein